MLTASTVERTEDSRSNHRDLRIPFDDQRYFHFPRQCELLTEVVSFLESLSREELNLGLMFALQ